MKVTIEAYTFCIRQRNSKSRISLSKGSDLYLLFKDRFINYIHNAETGDIPAEQRTVKVPIQKGDKVFHGFSDVRRSVFGIIETGLYGKTLSIANKDNPEHILYTSKKEDAVIKPFFFLICIPHKGDTGYIILERTDNEGIYSLFRTIMISFLNKNYDGGDKFFTLDRANYLTKEFVDELKNGTLKSVTFNLKSMLKDKADAYLIDELENCSISLKISFKGGLLPDRKIAKALRSSNTIFTSEPLRELFDDSEKSIVTESSIGGKTSERTVYLSEESKRLIRPYYVIDVNQNPEGYSDYESIKDSVLKFVDDNLDLKNLV